MGRDRKHALRRYWDSSSDGVIHAGGLAQYAQHAELRAMLLATSRRPSAVHGHDSREHPDRDADDQPEEQLHAERRALNVRCHARRDEGHAIERRFEHERHTRGRPARRGRRTQGGLAVRHRPSLSPALAGGADRACETIVAARTT